MADAKYNGWTNYETWNVALWIDNEEGSYNHWREQAREALEAKDNDKDDAISLLSDQLANEIKEGNPLAGENNMYSDILSANLSAVDWYEIASNWIDEVYEEAEPEEAEA